MKKIRIDITLEISEKLLVPAIAICDIIEDRIQEEYGDEVKTIILPYYKIKEIVFDESEYNDIELININNHIENYWLDIEDSIN